MLIVFTLDRYNLNETGSTGESRNPTVKRQNTNLIFILPLLKQRVLLREGEVTADTQAENKEYIYRS